MPDVIAERVFAYPSGPVTVRIYRPVQHNTDGVVTWTCRAEWDGLDIPCYNAFGLDSAESLFHALNRVSTEVTRHDGLRLMGDPDEPEPGWRRNPWPIESGPASLPVPIPLPGDVILERMLAAPGADGRTVRVAVHRPQPRGAQQWVCHYEIDNPDRPDQSKRGRASGTDSAQAVFLALQSIKVDVEILELTRDADNPWEVRVEPLATERDPI
jgi:hypothetical protein